jgi:beta-lactam-binding protein with PASTA domain
MTTEKAIPAGARRAESSNIGTVMSQRPGAGSYALHGTHVAITIGKFNPRLCS